MRRRGFTLFEVILALAIVVILMGTLATTLKTGFDEKKGAEEAVASVRDLYTAGDIFAIDVGNVPPPNASSADQNSLDYQEYLTASTQQDPTLADSTMGGIDPSLTGQLTGSFVYGRFQGDSLSLAFFTTGNDPRDPTPSGARYITYSLSQQPNGEQALVRSVESNVLSDTFSTGTVPANVEVLATGVRALQFQFFDGSGWADSWDTGGSGSQNVLPYAVKMILTLAPVREGRPERVVQRIATVWCAQHTVSNYNVQSETETTTTSPALGLP